MSSLAVHTLVRNVQIVTHLPARCVYKRVWSRSKICVILVIIITSNLILSIISIRPGVALSLKDLLI